MLKPSKEITGLGFEQINLILHYRIAFISKENMVFNRKLTGTIIRIWEHHVIGPISTNCYVFGKRNDSVMIDPGGPDAVNIAKKLYDNNIKINHILVTHGHFDHFSHAGEVKRVFKNAKIYLSEKEKSSYVDFINAMVHYGLPKVEFPEVDVWLKPNQKICISDLVINAIHAPGHSPGSTIYYLETQNNQNDLFVNTFNGDSAFVGDVLFENSVGRVDLPHSNSNEMISSLKNLMKLLPPNTQIYPGHGNFTSMDVELKQNPYLLALQRDVPIF